jgi:translation initiation factor IF-1
MNNRKDKKGGYSKHLKKGGGSKKSTLYNELDEGQLFGQITKVDGEGRFTILCNDGITRRGKACNQIRKIKDKKLGLKTFIIISLRDCDTKDDKCDILAFADPPNDILLYFNNNNNDNNNIDKYEIVFEKQNNGKNNEDGDNNDDEFDVSGI